MTALPFLLSLRASAGTFLWTKFLVEYGCGILRPYERLSGYVIYGENEETPASYSTAQRTYQQAFAVLGLKGHYNNHDWRATFGTQLKESGLSSAQVADLMGHADTRMVETTYARKRHEGVMKHREMLEMLNSTYCRGTKMRGNDAEKPKDFNGN